MTFCKVKNDNYCMSGNAEYCFLIKLLILFKMVVLSLLLSGCNILGSDINDHVKNIEKLKSETSLGEVPPPIQFDDFESVVYMGHLKRDPFAVLSFIPDEGPGIERPRCVINRELDVWENYPLSTFSVVGFMELNGQKWALMKTTGDGGTTHRLTIGDHLGKNYGEIMNISKDGGVVTVEILEMIDNPRKGCLKRNTTLSLEQ